MVVTTYVKTDLSPLQITYTIKMDFCMGILWDRFGVLQLDWNNDEDGVDHMPYQKMLEREDGLGSLAANTY